MIYYNGNGVVYTQQPSSPCNRHKTERIPALRTSTVNYDVIHRPDVVFNNPPIYKEEEE